MEQLKQLEGQKIKLRAIVKGFGSIVVWQDKEKRIILLKNIIDSKGNLISFEMTITLTKKLESLNLKKGDFITFHAFVKHDPDSNGYKLVNPSQIGLISRNKEINEKKNIETIELNYDRDDIRYIIDNHDKINEKVKSIIKDFDGYENLIRLYEQIKGELILKELVTLDIFIRSLDKSFTFEERKDFSKNHNINSESLEEIIQIFL